MTLADLLARSAALHTHLCPRQVLGVRMGLLAGTLLGLEVPRTDRRMLVIVETDGCAADGISVATGCWVGKRTLRVEDVGKVAATFVDTRTERALRLAPRPRARDRAVVDAPEATDRWHAQLLGYQRMSDDDLLTWQEVILTTPVATIVSQPGLRVPCDRCGEDVMNGREVVRDGTILCRPCAGVAYYRVPGRDLPPGLTGRRATTVVRADAPRGPVA
ncbi:MAG TPA: FmdE family protein [Chloroflexota bacterium]|nr:FmdE family protein [Chloroflexota bacterium]